MAMKPQNNRWKQKLSPLATNNNSAKCDKLGSYIGTTFHTIFKVNIAHWVAYRTASGQSDDGPSHAMRL